MKKDKNIVAIFGTRPEVIKLSPLLKADKTIKTIFTGQHTDLTKNICDELKIRIDNECCIKEPYTLTSLIADLAPQLEWHFNKILPDIVIVQGDTISAYIGALVAWMKGIDVAHIEAGLRTDTLYSPYPEEFFRRSIDTMAKYQFAPTKRAYRTLQKENEQLKDKKILINTGNTIVDTVNIVKKQISDRNKKQVKDIKCEYKNFVLTTLHRKENIQNGMSDIFEALKEISKTKRIVMIEHPTPILKEITKTLKDYITLIPPVGYRKMIKLIAHCDCIISDSGGLSEEAVCLKKPILITRTETERKEVIRCGIGYLTGTKKEDIVKAFNNIKKITKLNNPFGDGQASQKIINKLK